MSLFDASVPREHAKTLVLLFVLGISVVGNVMSIWWYGGKIEHYIPVTATGETGPKQESKPGVFPVAIQTHVAYLVVKTLGNVTPDSLLSAIQIVRPYLAPDTYVAMHAQAKLEAETMAIADVSIMTTDVVMTDVTPLVHKGFLDYTRIKFSATRRMFSYGMPLEPHAITVLVDVMPPQVGSGLGDALRVTHIDWPALKIKDGEFQNFTFKEKVTKQVKKYRRGVTR